ncbi:MAG TPA: glycosyltransferase [Casimicrobiaceae bacterium]|nr:glycosyltransferase [Casimicrobiaceae bacterium]
MTPLASIVVPLLRQPLAWLTQCVQSALRQTVPCEVLVVVSPRTPADLLQALAEWRHVAPTLSVLPETGTGFAAALNTGIRACRTKRIGFLLSDDWLESEAVETCLAHEADIVSTGLRVFAEDGEAQFASLHRRPSQARYQALPSIDRRAAYLEHFFLFRREALMKVGGVDETIGSTGVDDFDLVWTLLEQAASVVVVPDQVYNYRDHGRERLTLRAPALQLRDLGKILDKHHVREEARERMLREHAVWFGAPVHVVAERLAAGSVSVPT